MLDQRALRAEPTTAGTLAAIQIITRTECHCACPKGSTSKGERETLLGRHDTRRLLYPICPKGRNSLGTLHHHAQARLLIPMRTKKVTALVTFPIRSTFLMSFRIDSTASRLWVFFTPSPFSHEFAFSQHISVYSTHSNPEAPFVTPDHWGRSVSTI